MNDKQNNWVVGDVVYLSKSTSAGKAGEMRLLLEDHGTHFVYTTDVGTTGPVRKHSTADCPDPRMVSPVWARLDMRTPYDRLLRKVLEAGVLVDIDFRGEQVVINSRALCAEKEKIQLHQEIAVLNQKLASLNGSVAPGQCQMPGQCKTFSQLSTVAIMEMSPTRTQHIAEADLTAVVVAHDDQTVLNLQAEEA